MAGRLPWHLVCVSYLACCRWEPECVHPCMTGRLPWRVHVHETIPKHSGDTAQQLHWDGDQNLLEFDNQVRWR